jgi:cytochrome c-type biogenesis protein CcmH
MPTTASVNLGKPPGAIRIVWFVLVVLLAAAANAAPVFAASPPDTLANRGDEARARSLQKEFRCLVCQGQSLDESDAPLAADLRHLIRQRIRLGDTDQQIERYLVARYGDFILMKPPFEPSTYGLWLAPLALLLIGGLIALTAISRAGKRAGRA